MKMMTICIIQPNTKVLFNYLKASEDQANNEHSLAQSMLEAEVPLEEVSKKPHDTIDWYRCIYCDLSKGLQTDKTWETTGFGNMNV